jgi:hypothetical protein
MWLLDMDTPDIFHLAENLSSEELSLLDDAGFGNCFDFPQELIRFYSQLNYEDLNRWLVIQKVLRRQS